MNDATTPEGGIYEILDGKVDALTAIERVVNTACNELRIFDVSPAALRERNFGRPARIERMRTLLLAARPHRVRIVLHNTVGFHSELPRLATLLDTFSGQVSVHRSTGEACGARDVMVIADRGAIWRKPQFDHPRSILQIGDETAVLPWLERFEAIWELSEPAVSANTTGLG